MPGARTDAGPTDQTKARDVAAAPSSARPQVLLLSDQPARLLTYESILEGVGVDCVRVDSDQHALELLSQRPFATVMLVTGASDGLAIAALSGWG